MPVEFIRLCRLYNNPPVKERKARRGKPGRRARPARKGLLDVGKTKLFEDIIERPGASPNIPGTDVPRLRLTNLGPKARVATSDETTRVIEGLRLFWERQARLTTKRAQAAPSAIGVPADA